MKAKLTFDLPEENWDFECALHAYDIVGDLRDFENEIRSQLKHGHTYATVDTVLEYVYSELTSILSQVNEPNN